MQAVAQMDRYQVHALGASSYQIFLQLFPATTWTYSPLSWVAAAAASKAQASLSHS